jgi:DNA-binding transcriptional ArsR family regulator
MSLTLCYKALSDDSRLRILKALSRSSFSVQELTQILNITQSTVSHHLKVLTQAGMVESQKNGTWVYYRLCEQNNSNPEQNTAALLIDQFITLSKSNPVGALNGLSSTLESDDKIIEKLLEEKREELKKFFDSAAPRWKTIREQVVGHDSYFNEVLKYIRRDETLLELGCGAGAFLDALLPRPGATIAVDYSESMLEAAKKNLGRKADSADLRLGYLEHLPVANSSVNVTVSYMVMPFIRDPKIVLTDVYRALKNDGRIILVESGLLETDPSCYPTENLPRAPINQIMHWLKSVGFQAVENKEISKDVFLIIGTKNI